MSKKAQPHEIRERLIFRILDKFAPMVSDDEAEAGQVLARQIREMLDAATERD